MQETLHCSRLERLFAVYVFFLFTLPSSFVLHEFLENYTNVSLYIRIRVYATRAGLDFKRKYNCARACSSRKLPQSSPVLVASRSAWRVNTYNFIFSFPSTDLCKKNPAECVNFPPFTWILSFAKPGFCRQEVSYASSNFLKESWNSNCLHPLRYIQSIYRCKSDEGGIWTLTLQSMRACSSGICSPKSTIL